MTQTPFHPPVEDPDSPIAGLLGGPRYPGDIIGSVVGLVMNSWALNLVPRGFRSKLRDFEFISVSNLIYAESSRFGNTTFRLARI